MRLFVPVVACGNPKGAGGAGGGRSVHSLDVRAQHDVLLWNRMMQLIDEAAFLPGGSEAWESRFLMDQVWYDMQKYGVRRREFHH